MARQDVKEPWFDRFTIIDVATGLPYMTRYCIGRLRLHVFHRGDIDPDPHDHPWPFWTFPLNSYVEEYIIPENGKYFHRRRIVPAFWLSYRPATHTHRVLGRYAGYWSNLRLPADLEVTWSESGSRFPLAPAWKAGKIITIVWRGKTQRNWGFLKNRPEGWCWTPWKKYIYGGGKHAPCEESNKFPVHN